MLMLKISRRSAMSRLVLIADMSTVGGLSLER